ncbi:MAG TPA: chemotaxis protein CheX [Candidatus Saccharimonadales bacterium]|nr:chemotaxis protein CheX [Candidatus Saccharimonadales bacterium]
MRMELIQPFINAADAVLSQTLACPITVSDISMDEEVYQRRATAALVEITGDIEGRVIFDVEDSTAMKVACTISGMEMDADPQLIRETVAELANLVIGNAVTTLNDQGFRFKVHPPIEHHSEQGFRGSEDMEALIMDFASPAGSVFMNVAIRYNRRRRADQSRN